MGEKELKQVYKQKRQKVDAKTGKLVAGFVNVTFEMFLEWFDPIIFSQGCRYCGTTNERSFMLYQAQLDGRRPNATRGGKRGKRLELDRKDPFLHYDNLENVVWCCYWCNNAKSNFFTVAEFQPIADAIGQAIQAINIIEQPGMVGWGQ
jgi:hypothetical protein